MQQGTVRKEHYAYEKNGSCALLAAIEPLTGYRLAKLYQRRTKQEFTRFCVDLAAHYPNIKKIRLVLDNLNTHSVSAFYESLPADEAFALAQRFELYYTPKAASWLNMIEIEFSALARLCLDRRIPTMAQLETELMAIIADRCEKHVKIHWQFSIPSCRQKLHAHYSAVNETNAKFNKS